VEVTADWRKLHNEKLRDLYSSPDIIWVMKSRRMRWAGILICGGEERCIQGLMGKPEGKGPLGRPSHRWEDNIKIYLNSNMT
jgi:hypothetical protein